jgi:hypothetical protein
MGRASRPSHQTARAPRFNACVAQLGSMAKAARQLAVSQPVVLKTILDLESAVGLKLLLVRLELKSLCDSERCHLPVADIT